MQTKKCSKCKTTRDVSNFWKNKRSKDGYQQLCKDCLKGYPSRKTANKKYEAKFCRVQHGDKRIRVPVALIEECGWDKAKAVSIFKSLD